MIQSDLLYLTLVTNNDSDLFISLYSDPHIMENVGPAFTPKECKKMLKLCINQAHNDQPKNLFYVIRAKHDNQRYGMIGLLWNQAEKNHVELGVMILKPYINKGYAYKATYLLMQYAFNELNIKSIVIFCNESNKVANRATKAIGFHEINRFVDSKSNHSKIKWLLTAERFHKIYTK